MNKFVKLSILICMALLPARLWAVETAAQLLDRCIAQVNSAPSLEIKASMATNNGSTIACTLTLSREKFSLSSPQMLVWYDGSTQWTYSVESKELTITEPFDEELLQINPFAILKNYADNYTVRRLSSGIPKVELVAKQASAPVKKAVVMLNPTTYLPDRLDITLSNNVSVCILVSSAKKGATLPSTVFKFNPNKYPVKETNDLR